MNIVIYGLIASLICWGSTALGAASIFFVRDFKQKILDGMLGFAAGVMIAASFFSLLIPALEYAKDYNKGIPEILIVSLGFLAGAIALLILDKVTPHLHLFEDDPEGPKSNLRRSILLFLAITMHNIPEGLAVGVAFGAFNVTGDPAVLSAALALAIGIGIQNFPEGAAVSFPLYRDGMSKMQSFLLGQASGLVEPVGIVIGIILVNSIKPILPFALAFAAGAMIFVVVEELIPESQRNKNTDFVTMFTILGLVVMMVLDYTLG